MTWLKHSYILTMVGEIVIDNWNAINKAILVGKSNKCYNDTGEKTDTHVRVFPLFLMR